MQMVRERDLEEDVIFTGWVKDPARYFAAFDLYLLSSMPLEGVPGAIIEATLAGVPVVGFDCYGVREIPGVQATLVPPKDVPALTSALRQEILNLANSRNNDNGNGNGKGIKPSEDLRAMHQQFDMDRMVRETWQLYHQLIGS
jgi:glycosyltransferase involved in cell wall biosynthesis